jgi:hypothetical protein
VHIYYCPAVDFNVCVVILCTVAAEGFTAITADGKILKKVLRHGFESSGKASILNNSKTSFRHVLACKHLMPDIT